MKDSHGQFFVYFLYLGVLVVALAGIGVDLTVIRQGATKLSQQVQPTLLDLRVQSSLEIRQALAKQLPPPEPLPPRTVRSAHATGIRVSVSLPMPRELSREVRNALATGSDRSSSMLGAQSGAYPEFDRHSYQWQSRITRADLVHHNYECVNCGPVMTKVISLHEDAEKSVQAPRRLFGWS